jgi:AraC-like DNA-binding protein
MRQHASAILDRSARIFGANARFATLRMDALSEVLKAVRLEGALFFNAEFSAPWCISSSPSLAFAPYLCPGAEHLILFHFLTEGRAYVRVPEGPRVDLAAGDIVVLPHGDAHLLGNGLPEEPVDSLTAMAPSLTQGLAVTRFGGGGEITRLVCGYLACEPRLSGIFLAGLPRVLNVHITGEPSGQWLQSAIRFSVDEAAGTRAGGGLVVSRLAEVLFVETLRCYINSLSTAETGWLAASRDPVIGRALALLHQEPAEPWTIDELSRRVGLSRSRLTDRFRHFLASSPMAYLTRWRMKLAAEMLEERGDSVVEVAAAVGYASEAAFNRAFKREFASPPARFRRKRASQPDVVARHEKQHA